VAQLLFLMYAPQQRAQYPCHRVLSVACPGFLTGADIRGDVGATRDSQVVRVGCKKISFPFVCVHGSLHITPAMAAGVADHAWSIEEMMAGVGEAETA
jgi:hypothetical protein